MGGGGTGRLSASPQFLSTYLFRYVGWREGRGLGAQLRFLVWVTEFMLRWGIQEGEQMQG